MTTTTNARASDNVGDSSYVSVDEAIDDKLLQKRLNKAMFHRRLRAFLLVLPILLFLFVVFIIPICLLYTSPSPRDS